MEQKNEIRIWRKKRKACYRRKCLLWDRSGMCKKKGKTEKQTEQQKQNIFRYKKQTATEIAAIWKLIPPEERYFLIQKKKAEGNFPLPADNDYQQPQPHPLPHSRSNTIMIQQLSPLPHPLLQPQPLFPHRHKRMMIQRILQQELFPQESPQPLLHPLSHPQPLLLLQQHPPLSSPQPQFVAAKSLMLNPPDFLYTLIICEEWKCVTGK